MDIFEVKYALEHITLLVDTREQNTPALRRRLESSGLPYERRKLDFGDYSAQCQLEDGTNLLLNDAFSIERKMSLNEIATCFCGGRSRFQREFERAQKKGAKMYLLVENASWEMVYNGDYRSRMHPNALIASTLAWLARYDCQLLFCRPETTGKLIADIIYREIKERLERGDFDEACA